MKDTADVIDFAAALSQVRKSHTPKASDPTARRVSCRECNKTFTRGKTQRQYVCPSCTKQRQIDAGVQMVEKSGPFYERTVRGQLRFWLGEAERLGISWGDDAS